MDKRRIFHICATTALTLAFAFAGLYFFKSSYLRLAESFCDVADSLKYFFQKLTKQDVTAELSVLNYSEHLKWNIILPSDFKTFGERFIQYFSLLSSPSNIAMYGKEVAVTAGKISKVTAIVAPCLMIIVLILSHLYMRGNTKHNKDTLPLKVFRTVSGYTYQPIKRTVLLYKSWLDDNSIIYVLWAIIWLVNLNIATVITEFFAYYFFFISSFDLSTLYPQICKLFIDLQVIFEAFPWWSLALIAYVLFDRFRKRIADETLHHFEARNCGFINTLPIVSMTCGSMGKKKTTMVTDMALSQEVMFRQKALEILQSNDMKFPHFPWLALELELKKCMKHHTVYNLATVADFVRKKRERYERHTDADLQLFGYDVKRYGIFYSDALKTQTLFEVMETYTKAYFIYVIESSLIVSNYSIRVDNTIFDEGNFPLWDTEFFADGKRCSRHSHILDFDTLRLGRKVIENNPLAGSFEFGVVVITEVGKERGNNLELKEVKKGNDETNQKNDLFNSWLKMCRHSATVDSFPFIKVFTDEQRPESWGADARDLCDIITIQSTDGNKLALPFYTLEDMASEILFNRFLSFYTKLRFKRGDNTLLCHILKSATAWLWRRNIRIYNRYGYSVLKVAKERGTMDGKPERQRYYLMNKKIYSRRFSTDCFSDYFNDMAKNCDIGLRDYLEYVSEKATVDELRMQNSYFVRSLYKDSE